MRKLMLCAGLAAAWPSIACAEFTLAQDAAAFGVRESIAAADLSPDGRKVVYIEPGPGAISVAYVADVETGKAEPFFKAGGTQSLRWCGFVTDTRLICRYSEMTRRDGILVPFGRLVAINSDGSQMKELGQQASWYDERIRQYDGNIVDWLPGEGGSVLMSRQYIPEAGRGDTRLARTEDGVGVDQVDTVTLKSKPVEKPRKDVSEYMSDGRGNVRLLIVPSVSTTGELSGRTRIDYRTAGSREWRPLLAYDADDVVPLAVDATSDSLYALKKLDGRQALYRIRLTAPAATQLVVSHPRVDIDDVIRSASGQQVIGYSYVEDKRETVYFEPEHKALAASLSKALPGLPLIRFVGGNQDGTRSLFFAGSDSDPGRYYLFDRTTKRLNELFLARPQLEKRELAPVKAVSVKVADGTQVPAYLTLPPGKAAKNLPSVVLPHGGPSSRDEWGFDWLAQFLAARGYAVIQPNYRGSAGFGDNWLIENGFKSWRTSVGDITDSLRWLVSQGIADPERLAAVGWSYGGYAALQAATMDPALFKAVAAIAPVTDLSLLKQEKQYYNSAQLVADFVGSGPHIAEGSPLRHAQAIRAPVLLAHGDMDLNVGINHSLKMESALRSAGTPIELLRYKDLDHQLDDSIARSELLLKVGQLLERTIGR